MSTSQQSPTDTWMSPDFAIVTALPVEREAFVCRLEDVEKIQFDDEPLTFYAGNVATTGETGCFRVIVVQLVDMGNADAGIAATRVIQRWKPHNVLMVGIAGGVREKVNLGDVVVSQYAYYYEPGKLTPDGDELRGRQFTSDLMLYARAQHYEAADWKGRIEVDRPDSVKPQANLPAVHFGPIACGEKVVADLVELGKLREQCPKMVAVAMEGAGVAKAVLSEAHPPRFLEIRGISDYAGPEKNDGWHKYAANTAAAFTIGLLRDRPFSPCSPPAQNTPANQQPGALVISVQSLRVIPTDEPLQALDDVLKHGEVEFLNLDMTDLVQNKAFTDPETAARRLTDPDGSLLSALARRSDSRLAFNGLAAIPPVVLTGHIVTDRRFVRLFDFHPDNGNWFWPGNPDRFAALQCKGLPKRLVKTSGEVFLRMAISYPVSLPDTRALGLKSELEIDLSLQAPARSVVQSEEQVRAYGRQFREVLDQLTRVMPGCQRLHLFYAGPMALAFHLGQQISENIHPPVAVWNYSRGYEWAIDLRAAVSGEPCVLRPEQQMEAV
jgi:nucleoside phosphorylase